MQIKLVRPHTHAGRDYPAGAILDLDADAAQWLVAIGAAARHVTPAAEATPGLPPLESSSARKRAIQE